MKYFILSLILLCCSVFVKGQNQYSAEPSPVLLKERWEAEWITCPESSLYVYPDVLPEVITWEIRSSVRLV